MRYRIPADVPDWSLLVAIGASGIGLGIFILVVLITGFRMWIMLAPLGVVAGIMGIMALAESVKQMRHTR